MKNLLYILFFLPVLALAQTMPRANTIRYTPSGFLSAINVQTAIDELEAEKARLIDGNGTTAAGGTINMGGDAESSILIEGNTGLDFHVGNTTAFEDIKTEASDSTVIRSGTKIILESTTDDIDLIAADTVDISAPVVTFNKVPGTAGQVLTSDASGGVSFEDPTGSGGGGASNRFPPNVQTGNYVFVALDTARMTIMRSVSAQNITIPPDLFTVGDMLQFYQDSTNVLTIVAGSGVSFTNSSGSLTCSQDDPVVLYHRSTNHWVIWKKSATAADQQQTLNTVIVSTGNVTTGEDQLFSYTLEANRLQVDGESVAGRFSGIVANNGNTKTIRLKFGATTIATRTTTTPTIGQGWTMDWQCFRTGATSQRCNITFSGSDGVASSYYTVAGETLSGTVDIVLTGDATATDDIIMHTSKTVFEP